MKIYEIILRKNNDKEGNGGKINTSIKDLKNFIKKEGK